MLARTFARPFALAALAVAAACAPTPKHALAVGVVLAGEREPLEPRAVPGLELSPVELAPAARPADATTALLAEARSAFGAGKSDACRAALGKLAVPELLAAEHRDAAARALTLEAGCAYLAGAVEEARAIAVRFAAYGLELPSQAVGFEVEQLIGDAITAGNARPRQALEIAGEPGARVVVDGLPAACLVPCRLELAPGEHVVAVDADGFEPAWQLVRVPDSARVAIAQRPASAERAAAQWRARVGRGQPATDEVGAALLARATRHSRLLYLRGERQLVGSLILDGRQRAAITGERGRAAALARELAYDAGLLRRPRAWQRPWFWIAVAGVALAASGAIVYVTYEPEVRTRVGF